MTNLTLQPQFAGDDSAVANTLVQAVGHSEKEDNITQHIHGHHQGHFSFLKKWVPELETLASTHHVGNFVVDRQTGERFFESMPIYARLGMHLLFCGKQQVKLLEGNKHIEQLLRDQSIREGEIYDNPQSFKSIQSFITTYQINTEELLETSVTPQNYPTFNSFFYRRLRPGARIVENVDDPNAFCSAADSRLVVYPTIDLAQKFWVKGDEFTLPKLLNLDESDEVCQSLDQGSLAIFRLAPADYHRFHSPVDAKVLGNAKDIPGQYYTVNPQAVNEQGFDVFSMNRRSVLYLEHHVTKKTIAYIAVGALLVGSVKWTTEANAEVKRGDELGYFAYGGSTIIAVFPPGVIEFDKDLVKNSEGSSSVAKPKGSSSQGYPIETLVKVGNSLGHVPSESLRP
ncbi:phosphatidylserine decarboxylase-domain-containing protein [Hygrophoropsis aurantiaca]|uniref:Phosphatidylserine decarboxylase-domain-containing protein n=1 Tax=Hygrophoropsis aurantiaca TaxID=72124 RepID=A0ACB8AIN2_9AGAM|nr:phosphatidylserine decarboxylase-domain-containing protein [Hygrophoropsis aurantiaca]